MILDNFRIWALDPLNITFDEYREVENKKDKTKSYKWIRTGGYYSNVQTCLNAIRDYIIHNYIINQIEGYEETLEKIKELHDAIVQCDLKGMEK